MTLIVREGEINWPDGLAVDDIPDGLPSQIRIHGSKGRIGLEPQGLVGTLLLNNGETLNIVPKIGMVNFYRMLLRAEGSISLAKRELDRIVDYQVDSSKTITDVIAPQFLDSIEYILSRGLFATRAKRLVTSSSAQGRLLPIQTNMRLKSLKDNPVVSIRQERSFDTSENRLLLGALNSLQASASAELRRRCLSIASRLSSFVPTVHCLQEDLLDVDKSFASHAYGGARDYYRSSLMMAKIILGCSGLSVNGISTVKGQSILINAPLIFERYLRESISELYASRGFHVQDGGRLGKYLYNGGTFELKPDILAFYKGRIALLADAKYKQPTQSDHYQMMAYLRAFGQDKGLIIKPSDNPSESELVTYTSISGERVYQLGIPLGEPEVVDSILSQVVEKYGTTRP